MQREGTTVTFLKNGKLIHTCSRKLSGSVLIDASLAKSGARLIKVMWTSAAAKMQDASRLCSACPVDTYSDREGLDARTRSGDGSQTTCTSCPASRTTVSETARTEKSQCSSCADGYFAVGHLCNPCAENATAIKVLVVFLVAVGFALGFYYLAARSGRLEKRQHSSQAAMGSKSAVSLIAAWQAQLTSSAARAKSAAFGSTQFSILVPSFQFTVFSWQLSFKWPAFMVAIASWLSNVTMPDFASVMAVECQMATLAKSAAGKAATDFVIKLLAKQGVLIVLAFVYLVPFAVGGRHVRNRCIQALAVSFSIMYMIIARSAIDSSAFTRHADGHWFLDALPAVKSCVSVFDCDYAARKDFYIIMALGLSTAWLMLYKVPVFYFQKLSRASKRGAYISDEGKMCVGPELWSVEFSNKYAWFYARYTPRAWWFEFVLMFRKLGLSAAALYFRQQIAVQISAVIILLSLLTQLAVRPFHSGIHEIEESTMDAASVMIKGSLNDCDGKRDQPWQTRLQLDLEDVTANIVKLVVYSGKHLGKKKKKDERWTVVVTRKQADEIATSGTVHSREHAAVEDLNGKDDTRRQSASDKLEVVSLLCLLGNYVVAINCFKFYEKQTKRSVLVDALVFVMCSCFLLLPFFKARTYHKQEKAAMLATFGADDKSTKSCWPWKRAQQIGIADVTNNPLDPTVSASDAAAAAKAALDASVKDAKLQAKQAEADRKEAEQQAKDDERAENQVKLDIVSQRKALSSARIKRHKDEEQQWNDCLKRPTFTPRPSFPQALYSDKIDNSSRSSRGKASTTPGKSGNPITRERRSHANT